MSHDRVYELAACYDIAFDFRDVPAECDFLTHLARRHTGRSPAAFLELAAGPAAGVLDRDPIVGGSSESMVNGALNAFAMAAAIEMPRGLRINSVSPGLLEESEPTLGDFFPGAEPVPAARVARAYAKSVEGAQTGKVFVVE